MLLPYRMEHELSRLPWVTILVSLVCLFIHVVQQNNWRDIEAAARDFCDSPHSPLFRPILGDLTAQADDTSCEAFVLTLYWAQSSDERIAEIVAGHVKLPGLSDAASDEYAIRVVHAEYQRFAALAPEDLTDRMDYVPSSWNPVTMITSAFAHADWDHVIFNVIFFVAFAATVEGILGHFSFIGLFIASCLFIGVAFSLTSFAAGEDIPTIGLSGVVTTMIAMFAFLLPKGRIRCLYWLVFIGGRIAIPAWILAAFFIGHDVYYLFFTDYNGSVNFVAHVAGAAFGAAAGVCLFEKEKQHARAELADHERRQRGARYAP